MIVADGDAALYLHRSSGDQYELFRVELAAPANSTRLADSVYRFRYLRAQNKAAIVHGRFSGPVQPADGLYLIDVN